MVRWRYCLVLAMLLMFPLTETADDDDDDEAEDNEPDDNDGDDIDDDVEEKEKMEVKEPIGRRAPAVVVSVAQTAATRTVPRRPLECYVCAYKADTLLKSCLDPTKHRVHTMTCHNVDEKCFTSVVSKGNNNYEAVMRGCRSSCLNSPEVTCCELNRCNNQAFALPVAAPRQTLVEASVNSKTAKALPPTILFFVTVLLVLQTVVKVAVV